MDKFGWTKIAESRATCCCFTDAVEFQPVSFLLAGFVTKDVYVCDGSLVIVSAMLSYTTANTQRATSRRLSGWLPR